MSDLETRIRITGDSSDAERAINDTLRSVDKVRTDLARTSGKIAAFEQASKDAEELQRALAEAQRKLAYFREQAKISGDTGQKAFAADVRATEREVERLNGTINRQQAALRGMAGSLASAGVDTRNLASEKDRLAGASARAEKQTIRLKNQFLAEREAAKDAAKNTSAAGDAAEKAGQQSSAGAGGVGILATGLKALAGAVAIKELSQAADEYANMAGRLKLVAGEGEGLATALANVRATANGAGADIAATTDLYTTLARSTKESASGVNDLVSTIVKAFAVSGTGAAAAEGATRQLSQALASGVLRGDEFNSTLEQAPRLAQAMSDSLGVTTGELRNMAKEGQLTADTVISALKAQAGAIDSEFSQLPDTIGRATQRLSNEWTVFIGELDKTSGASALVSSALNGIAGNLDSIAHVAGLAGAAAAAAFGPQLLQSILATGNELVAATAKAGGLRAALASMPATIPITVVITASLELLHQINQAADDAEKTFAQAGRISEEAGARAERMAEQLALALAGMRTALADVVAPSTQGYVDLFNKITEGAKTADEKVKLTAEALEAMAKALDKNSEESIKGFGEALERLAVTNGLSAEQVRGAWEKTLKSLTGNDLASFTTAAKTAFDEGWKGANALATVMDISLRKSIAATGQDWSELSTGISSGAASSIGHVENLAGNLGTLGKMGVNTGAALKGALDQAVKAADTEKAIAAIIGRIETLGREGKLSGDLFAAAMESARRKADELTPGVNSLEEAYKRLGITSQAALQKEAEELRTALKVLREKGASLEDIRAGWVKYAQAAIAANGGIASETIRAGAAMNGYEIAVDKAGKTTLKAMGEAADSIGDVADLSSRAAAEQDRLADAAERAAQAARDRIQAEKTANRAAGSTRTWDMVFPGFSLLSAEEQNAFIYRYTPKQERDLAAEVRKIADTRSTSILDKAPGQAPVVGSFRITLQLPSGRSDSVNLASQADAQRLRDLLQQLQADMVRS